MKQNEIISGTELIAIFDGWKHIETPKNKGKGYWNKPSAGYAQYDLSFMKYRTSWDWLMPVVEKIENLEENIEVQIGKNLFSRPQQRYSCIIHNDGDAICFEEEYANEPKINGVWRMVVAFIQWHNSNSKVETSNKIK